MPKYYCDYCRSYLTHDSLSVRKSHLIGRNHLKYYCDYYEEQAKKLGLWEPNELPYELTLEDYYRNIPGKREVAVIEDKVDKRKGKQISVADEELKAEMDQLNIKEYIPPPPAVTSLPAPPPAVYFYNAADERKKIALKMLESETK